MRAIPAGGAALLLECEPGEVETWRAELAYRRETGELSAAEIVPGARTILLDGLADPAAVVAQLTVWSPAPVDERSADAGEAARLVEIPTVYDGPDLTFVAEHWGVEPAEAVARHAGTEYRVAFCGFAPGFGYLAGLPWPVPRLPTPRHRVAVGSVGLAGEYCGVYPTASPGGWRLIGRTSLVLFDADRDPPALLTPGARVRFVPVPGGP